MPAAPPAGSALLTPLVIDHVGPLGLLGPVGRLMRVVGIVVYGGALTKRP